MVRREFQWRYYQKSALETKSESGEAVKRKENDLLEYLTGFPMGLIGGILPEFSIPAIYHSIAKFIGYPLFDPAWWKVAPLPIWVRITMAKTFASLHLEEY